MITIYLPVMIVFMFLIVFLKSKLIYFVMNSNYYRMLVEENPPIDSPKKLFTPKWISSIENDGFLKGVENSDYVLYYQFYPKLKEIAFSGHVLVNIVLAKKESVDFYSESIDRDIDFLYSKYAKKRRVRKQITLQFKKYTAFNDDTKDEIDKIVCYKNNDNYIINITVGYLIDKNMVYFLYPKKRYPNKYYFYACQKIKELCGMDVSRDNGEIKEQKN